MMRKTQVVRKVFKTCTHFEGEVGVRQVVLAFIRLVVELEKHVFPRRIKRASSFQNVRCQLNLILCSNEVTGVDEK